MTPKAFENAITTIMALGGSTNAVLHLLAMSREAGCPLDLEDFQRISDKTPFIADLKPSGKYLMEDLHKVGPTTGKPGGVLGGWAGMGTGKGGLVEAGSLQA